MFCLDVSELDIVSNDGAPSGKKEYIIWNPPTINSEFPALGRRSSIYEASHLMRFLMKRGIRVILFCKVTIVLILLFIFQWPAILRFGKSVNWYFIVLDVQFNTCTNITNIIGHENSHSWFEWWRSSRHFGEGAILSWRCISLAYLICVTICLFSVVRLYPRGQRENTFEVHAETYVDLGSS